jgi:pimeloyl-ACP methyl ester carboxylesterase
MVKRILSVAAIACGALCLSFAASALAASTASVRACDCGRAAVAASQKIAPGGIDDLLAVDVGGIQQWISVRGNDPANPLLLFLHGGPGSPMMPESWTFQRPWEDFFTVVQWDQRGGGKTFTSAKRKPDSSMTIDEMQADAEQLIDLLLQKYGKRKLFLLGHSWGSFLGVRIAQHHPELLYAYIGVGQVVNMRRNEQVGYQMTLAAAEAAKNESAVRELKRIAPYPDADGSIPPLKTFTERKWDVALGGMLYGQSADDESQRCELSPQYDAYDCRSRQMGEGATAGILWPQLTSANLDKVSVFKCPVFIFAGSHDMTTPEPLQFDFYKRIEAPEKKYFRIERASHYVFSEAPGEMLVDLVQYVRTKYTPENER